MNTTVTPSTPNPNKQQKQTAKEVIAANVQALTYLWVVRNNKPEHRRGTITLVNGNREEFRTLMRRNLGKKRVELTRDTIREIETNPATQYLFPMTGHQCGHPASGGRNTRFSDNSYNDS
jgi:hypothetical protein